jgi:hypothetical protein
MYVNEAYIVTCIVNHVKQIETKIHRHGGSWRCLRCYLVMPKSIG